jgi:pimeloyl-ACP methyl ester carboxylesterase
MTLEKMADASDLTRIRSDKKMAALRRALMLGGIVMLRTASATAIVLCLTAISSVHAEEPLAIAKQGYFFVGGKYSTVGDKQVMNGQIYVEYQIPKKRTQLYPLVIVPGAAQTATNFNGTPDGREGWTQHFLRRGYAVYIVEQPGRGRSSYQPDTDGGQSYPEVLRVQQRFTAPEKYNLWPQARLHTQWPGTGTAGDPNFDQFFASQVPFVQKPEVIQALNRDAIAALIDKLGPVILMTHSQSGAYGWEAVDQRPTMVKALIQAEPSAPPVHDLEFLGAPDWFRDGAPTRTWGLTSIPITYAPPAKDASELAFERQEKADSPDLARCWLQKEPARQLPNLQKLPIAIVTGEASFHGPYEHCVVKFLEQAGVHPTWLNLGAMGIHGNGHMMMLEKNSDQIADVIEKWVRKALSEKTAGTPQRRASR